MSPPSIPDSEPTAETSADLEVAFEPGEIVCREGDEDDPGSSASYGIPTIGECHSEAQEASAGGVRVEQSCLRTQHVGRNGLEGEKNSEEQGGASWPLVRLEDYFEGGEDSAEARAS